MLRQRSNSESYSPPSLQFSKAFYSDLNVLKLFALSSLALSCASAAGAVQFDNDLAEAPQTTLLRSSASAMSGGNCVS